MPQQGNLFSSETAKTTTVGYSRPSRLPGWLRAIELILFVVLRVYVGIIVLMLPWTQLWKSNAFLDHWPALAAFCSYGAVRGIVSGLGLLNIWIAFTEGLRRRRASHT